MTRKHHTGFTGAEVKNALFAAVDAWERADCECCSPTALDDAFDGITAAEGDRLRKFGISVAQTGQWTVEETEAVSWSR